MTSGNKRLVMNTRERALSGDINRLQAFHDSDVAQVFWEMFGRYSGDDATFPGVETDPVAAAAPPYAGILNGLRAYPVNGTVNLLVTPGTMMVENPSVGVDDNAFKFVRDPGVQVAGALTLTAGGADVRIDVLEVMAVDAVLETDNRDIYNNGTGAFAPAVVTKVTSGRLQYRIRQGIEGGGFPGVAAGWVPLMVIRVPASAATWDDCVLWDVRPLVSENWNAPYDTRTGIPRVEAFIQVDETDAAPGRKLKLYGTWTGVWRGQRIDGAAGNPGGLAYVDVSDTTDNQASNYVAPGSGETWSMWLAFPFGLPGWRRYSPAPASPRCPQGLRGIPVFSNIGPTVYRAPSAAVGLPVTTGLGGTTSDCVCLCTGVCSSTGDPMGLASDGARVVYGASPPAITPGASDPLGTGVSTYTLLHGLYAYPQTAKGILVQFELSLGGAGGSSDNLPVFLNNPHIRHLAMNGVQVDADVQAGTIASYVADTSTSATWKFNVVIPILAFANVGTVEVTWNVTSTYVFTTVLQDKMTILGYLL